LFDPYGREWAPRRADDSPGAAGAAACVYDRSTLVTLVRKGRETKILIFVYGVLVTLVSLGVEPYAAAGIATAIGVAAARLLQAL
jgi:hypothetical protein